MIRFIAALFLLQYSLYGHAQIHKAKDYAGNSGVLIKYRDMITEHELSAHLHFIASDFFKGRKAGTAHERAVAYYLAAYYKSLGIPPPGGAVADALEKYFQPFTFGQNPQQSSSQNVLAFVEGSDPELKREIVVLVAHYDHLGTGVGIEGDSIFNGAADDASGTVALLEIAESLMEARKDGRGVRRSILFLHTGAEESGLHGSTHFVQHPEVPIDQILAVVNLDGVGGTDKPGAANAGNYAYLLYNDSTSLPLAERVRQVNYGGLEILKPQNPQRFNSDNKPFEYELVPAIYFSSGLTEHYHKVSDEASTIDYRHMASIVKLVFASAWELANGKAQQAGIMRAKFRKTGDYFCVPCGCKSDAKDFTQAGVLPRLPHDPPTQMGPRESVKSVFSGQ